MCLITFAYKVHPDFPLVFLANRDEYFKRQAVPLDWWDDQSILAGKDLEAGGSWLGINLQGKLAAITNFREGSAPQDPAPSRGNLVLGALSTELPPDKYFASQAHKPYRGFNLLFQSGEEFHFFTNRGTSQKLLPGIYGLSNGTLDSNWPKVNKAKELLASSLERNGPDTAEPFLDLFLDGEKAPDDQLPNTGVDAEWERTLSSIFIHTEGYGTRCTTFLTMDRDGRVEMTERSFNETGHIADVQNHSFQKDHAHA